VGLLDGTVDATLGTLAAPFKKFFFDPPKYRGPDYPEGFLIEEILPDDPTGGEEVRLVGKMMPHQPFSWGGEQKLVKEYYPGNPEPTVQVMGAREGNLKINGRFYAKYYPAADVESDEASLRGIPSAMRDLINGIRQRGSLVHLQLGEWERWGFIERADFKEKTIADIEYEIEFFIIGDSAPSECKLAQDEVSLPLDLNIDLISAALELEALQLEPFEGMDQDLFGALNSALGEVANAVALVTAFVDTVFSVADNAVKFANKAIGLVKYAQATIAKYKFKVGALQAYNGAYGLGASWNETVNAKQAKFYAKCLNATAKSPAITPAQKAAAAAGIAKYAKTPSTAQAAAAKAKSPSLDEILLAMKKKFEALAQYKPLARHVVKTGDTLQKISVKFYGTADNWKKIADHNKLKVSNVGKIGTAIGCIGTTLEIPSL
jgi:LysM repeat protein